MPHRDPGTLSVWPALLCSDALLHRQVWTVTNITHHLSWNGLKVHPLLLLLLLA